jgi:hypothetical protein
MSSPTMGCITLDPRLEAYIEIYIPVSTSQPSHDARGDGIWSVDKYVNLLSPVIHRESDDSIDLCSWYSRA